MPALTAPADDLPYGPFLPFVAPLVFGTVWAAFLALVMGVPVAMAIACSSPASPLVGWPRASAT